MQQEEEVLVKPFVKWPGGKTTELEIIHQYLPEKIINYIEPFLGGGACFFSLQKTQYNQAFVNDFSTELISLYRLIKEKNVLFNQNLQDIWALWSFFGKYSNQHYQQLRSLYRSFKDNELTKDSLKVEIEFFVESTHSEIERAIPESLIMNKEQLLKELRKSLVSKFENTKKNEAKKGDLPEVDYQKNIEASIRASVYTYYRYIYNERKTYKVSQELHIALFFYLREFLSLIHI